MNQEHPFAPYVRILGKGKTGTRSLDQQEARDAFNMILRNEVEPLQLGAFLMLLRVKEESAEELAGFVQACRENMPLPDMDQAPDLDWSSYAGKKSQQPWYILSALLLAKNGIRVLMHGSAGHTPERLYTQQVLAELGYPRCDSLDQAYEQINEHNFAWLPLASFCPPLEDIMQLKHLLGLRSPVNTLARLLNPARAKYSLQSVFHPAYAQLHQEADALLGQHHSMVFKGDGGEVEIKPQADTRCTLLRHSNASQITWNRQISERPVSVSELSTDYLVQLWRGEQQDSYGELASVETCAAALLLLEHAEDQLEARQLAQQWWDERPRGDL